MDKELNLQKRKFVEEYFDRRNGETSAIAAGYSRQSARSKASQLLKEPEVQAYLKELMEEAKQMASFDRQRIIQELEAIAGANMDDYVDFQLEEGYVEPDQEANEDQKPAANGVKYIASNKLTRSQKAAIQEITDSPKTGFKIRLHSKLEAIKILNSMQGHDAPTKTESVVHLGNIEKTSFSIKARAEDPE
jgi:phage terminase small subunit